MLRPLVIVTKGHYKMIHTFKFLYTFLFFFICSQNYGVPLVLPHMISWIVPYYIKDGKCYLQLEMKNHDVFTSSNTTTPYPYFSPIKRNNLSYNNQEIRHFFDVPATEKATILKEELGIIVPAALQTEAFFEKSYHYFQRLEESAFPGPWSVPQSIHLSGKIGGPLLEFLQDYDVYFIPVEESANAYPLEDISHADEHSTALTKKLIDLYEDFEHS